eukprot:sb/3471663/
MKEYVCTGDTNWIDEIGGSLQDKQFFLKIIRSMVCEHRSPAPKDMFDYIGLAYSQKPFRECMVVAARETLWKMNCKIEFFEHIVKLLQDFTGRPELPFWRVLLEKAHRVVGKSLMCRRNTSKAHKRQFDVDSTVKMLNQVICSGKFYKELIAEIEVNYVGSALPSSEVGAEVMCCFLKGG